MYGDVQGFLGSRVLGEGLRQIGNTICCLKGFKVLGWAEGSSCRVDQGCSSGPKP